VIPVAPVPRDRSGAHASVDADVGIAVQFSRSVEKAPAGLAAGLSKLNSMQAHEAPVAGSVDILGAGAASRTAECGPGRADRSNPGAP
jgi:hypothetical protein